MCLLRCKAKASLNNSMETGIFKEVMAGDAPDATLWCKAKASLNNSMETGIFKEVMAGDAPDATLPQELAQPVKILQDGGYPTNGATVEANQQDLERKADLKSG